MKLKLNTAVAGSLPAPASATVPTPSTGGGLKLSFKKPLDSAPALGPPGATLPSSAKRKNLKKSTLEIDNPKKRARDEIREDESGPSKKLNVAPSTIRLTKPSQEVKGPTIKLKNVKTTPITPIGGHRLKIKQKGKPPPRPPGVGYDSEASDAEDDPAIEENFVLRMAPGPDCDYLRAAIEERRLGGPVSQGGADVSMRFFSRDGRRAAVNIQGRHYAAILVDLPCIIESMKSWDRKGWWKSADISQMLLVMGRVDVEDAAKTYPLPREIDDKTWQWPHGLTAPMHNVRKRRFRKRVSHRTIEAAEEEVERLLALDEQAKTQKGRSEYEILDLDAMRNQEVESDEYESEYEDDGAQGEVDGNGVPIQYMEEDEEEDAEAMAARMALELGGDDETELDSTMANDNSVLQPPSEAAELTSPAAPAEEGPIGSGDDDEEAGGSDDDDEDEQEDEENEDDREQAQYLAQQREEIAHLEHEIQSSREQLAGQTNNMFRLRLTKKIESLQNDLNVKKRALGEEEDDS